MSFPFGLSAQRFSFRHYGQAEGLTNLAVQCLLQDRTGFLWVGTQNGLFRYDGHRFLRFYRTGGRISTRIEALHEGADGTLWVATRAGLAKRQADMLVPAGPDDDYTVPGRSPLTTDRQGRLFLATDHGLLIGAPAAGQFSWRWFTGPDELRGQPVWTAHADPAGDVWLGWGKRLCRLRGEKLQVLGPREAVPADRWDGILNDAQGGLWIRSARRLLALAPGASEFTPADRGLPFSDIRVPTLYCDRQGDLIVATDNGLALRTGTGWRMVGTANGLISNSVACILQDREDSLWVGLSGTGVARWMGSGEWESWTQADGLNQDLVWSIRRDAQGTLWAGTVRGLSFLPPGETRWRAQQRSAKLAENNIRAIETDGGGLWLGLDPGGIVHLDPQTGTVHRYGAAAGLGNDNVLTLKLDAQGRLWAGTRGGLFRGTGRDPKLRFERLNVPGGDAYERFYTVLPAAGGVVWAAGDRGLARFQGEECRRFTTRDGLKGDSLGYLTEDRQGGLWVGYREAVGVSRFVVEGDQLRGRHFSMQDGLSSNLAYFLGTDQRGRIWLGTDNGVNVYDRSQWRHYGRNDGLIWDDCAGNAFFGDPGGGVWIGTARGLSHFTPGGSPPQIAAPNAVVTSLRFNGRFFEPASSPVVAYSNRAATLGFAVLTFQDEGDVVFRYRLAELHQEWVETSDWEVQYPGLPAGTYTFQVTASDRTGSWHAVPAQVSFRILPPYWQTWWFSAVVAGLLLALGWVLWWRRTRRLMREHQRLEEAVRERTQELVLEQARTEQEKKIVEQQKWEIEDLLQQTEQASRSKSEFLANISHEIRTPLNGVLGMQALALDTTLSREQREYLGIAQKSAESLLSLLNDVLNFSKIEAGRLELDPVDFSLRNCALDAVRTLAAHAREKGLQIACEVAPEIPERVRGDAVRLRQVLLNLLGNAVKFTSQGSIAVRMDREAAQQDEMLLHVAVADTGIGIPADKQEVIFEAFRQADGSTTRHYGGTGLGLAICARLVSLMGGRLWVESEPGHGSTFHFTARLELSVPIPPPHARQPEMAPPVPVPGCSRRVLLAEDNPVNQVFARRVLEKSGHVVVAARNGREAVDLLEQQDFDLVLMDVQMPEMDGFEATRRIRQLEAEQNGRRLPILAMTAYAMAGDRERCLEAGMDDYVSKPIQPADLIAAVEKLCAYPEPPR